MLYLSTSSTDIENSEFKESILIFGIIYRKYFESKNYNLIEIEDIKNSCHFWGLFKYVESNSAGAWG